ncbi:MAG: translation initiation factor IF-2 [Nitrospirales bacterium]|nr:translation initiation factor IF-2 [Nitrospirales bacterium]
MRVYELAKMLGVESRVLIPELIHLGVEVTSHSNALDDDSVQKAIKAMAEKGITIQPGLSPETMGRKKSGSAKHSSKVSDGISKVREEGKRGQNNSALLEAEDRPKHEKKHILFKRRKAPLPANLEGLDELSPLEEDAESGSSPVTLVDPSVSSSETADLPSMVEPAADSEGEPTVSDTPISPSLPPVTLDEGSAVPSQPHAEKKTSEPSNDKIEGPEKRKMRKGGKHRDEDLFAQKYEDAARWQDLRSLPTLRREERSRHPQPSSPADVTKPRKKTVKLNPGVTVKEFAELLGQRPTDVIRKLMDVGLLLTLNQPMNLDAGVLLAEGYGVTAEIVQEKGGEALIEEVLEMTGESQLVPRPPVVTVMGHVDHGKTSLLDAIRQTKVTEREAGGITQHIGAYTVLVGEKQITFLDTPGHEAFTAMRARGAQATDIVILVVAADDGVMPQTIEAAHHAQAANVPIIVAVNKIDKPGANPDRVKQGLSEQGVVPEDWGGQTIFVEVSAKQKLGLEGLLDMILLQAEVLELKAEIGCVAKGIVLESKLDRGRGPVATVLVQSGVLRTGAAFVVGLAHGRVRVMMAHDGKKLTEAGPSMPVEVVGLLGVPSAGDVFVVVKDERMAREIAEGRKHKHRMSELETSGPRMTLDDLYSQIKEEAVKELSMVVKADVQGSLGALCESLRKISDQAVKLQFIHSGVGGITESDVLLAAASNAMIIGFHVRPEPKVAMLAERERVDIRLYTVIYNVLDDIKAAAEGLLDPTITERVLGRAEVREVFTIPKIGAIAGCYVSDGTIVRGSEGARIIRDHVTVYEGKIGSLRRFKDDVREVQQGYECGIGIENFNDMKVGDIIEAYALDKIPAKL